jgi:hypothetical protein
MIPTRPRWRERLAWLRSFEAVTVAASLATLVYLRLHGLDLDWTTIRISFPNLLPVVPMLLLQGVGLQIADSRLAGRSVRSYLETLRRPGWWLLWTRLWAATSLLAFTYMWLKVWVPLLRVELYDVELWKLDRWLHLGVSPTVFAIDLVAGTPVARWIDFAYGLWMPSIPLILAFFYAAADDAPRRNLALAGTIVWLGGAWIYLALPALGPCYSSPDVLEPIRESMPSAVGTQANLWRNYLTMIRSRGDASESFSPLFGVAAMPSLHVAAYAMFMLWARRHARRWFWPFVVGTAVIFFGSLATGWNYAVDGYAGIVLAWIGVRLADRLEPVTPEDASGPPPETPPRAATDASPPPAPSSEPA